MEVELHQIVDGDVADYANPHRHFCRQRWNAREEKAHNDDGNQRHVVNAVELFHPAIQPLRRVGDPRRDQHRNDSDKETKFAPDGDQLLRLGILVNDATVNTHTE